MRSRVFEEEAEGNNARDCRGSRGDAVQSVKSVAQKPATVLGEESMFVMYY